MARGMVVAVEGGRRKISPNHFISCYWLNKFYILRYYFAGIAHHSDYTTLFLPPNVTVSVTSVPDSAHSSGQLLSFSTS